MSDRDYYEILGLTPNADGAMVDAAYWHLVRRYQALASTDARARYLMDEVNEAYGVLGNPALRAQYDAFRDDVLIRRGVLKPIPSRPAARARSDNPAETPRGLALPSVSLRFWRTYATSAVLAALAFAGAWQGVNLAFVIAALAAGLAFSLTPVLRLQVPDINVALPSLPTVTMPDAKGRLLTMRSVGESVERLREASRSGEADDAVDADELQASTASMIARWRSSVGLQNQGSLRANFEVPRESSSASAAGPEPDAADAPVAAVIDILRGSRTSVPKLD